MSEVPVIAIDGPSASGKGTVAQRVADRLGFHYLDSGALYRLTAFYAAQQGFQITDQAFTGADEAVLSGFAAALPAEFRQDEVFLAGRNVSLAIRDEKTSQAASRVAAVGAVRDALMGRQRAFKAPPGLVADGRDMASVVFPEAILKVFLTASAEERANRRYKQLIGKGFDAKLADLLHEIRERDARDASRAHSPLVQDPEALFLDTTEMSIEAAVSQVLTWYQERSGHCD